MTAHTALEIFNHPYDISIGVGQEKEGEKFSFAICRGREHNYKPLISTTEPCYESLEEALHGIQRLLTTAITYSSVELEDSESLLAQLINPERLKVSQLEVLTSELVETIISRLREFGQVDTFDLKPTPTA
jgi:hypothetical protein